MGPTHKPLTQAIQSFGIDNAQKMRGKLEREYRRCCSAENADDLRDHCVNFAVTAWHLNEWVWAAVSRSYQVKSQIAAQVKGLAPQKIGKEGFVKWMLSKCPELEYCQSICNGSKHTATNGKKVFTVIEYVGDLDKPVPVTADLLSISKAYIILEGRRLEADEAFDKVLRYWNETLESRWAY